jgi:gliding motility-associated lipoprotein GldH
MQMKRHNFPTGWRLFLGALFALMTSCHQGVLYHSYQPVNPTGWKQDDTLVFTCPQTLYTPDCQLEIGIRHKDSYKYRDIWLTINTDTLHLYLADSIGNWEGNGIGDTRQWTKLIPFKSTNQDSIKELRITHIMQDTPLKGIEHIGIKIKHVP